MNAAVYVGVLVLADQGRALLAVSVLGVVATGGAWVGDWAMVCGT